MSRARCQLQRFQLLQLLQLLQLFQLFQLFHLFQLFQLFQLFTFPTAKPSSNLPISHLTKTSIHLPRRKTRFRVPIPIPISTRLRHESARTPPPLRAPPRVRGGRGGAEQGTRLRSLLCPYCASSTKNCHVNEADIPNS